MSKVRWLARKDTREAQTRTSGGPRFESRPQFHEKTPQREKKRKTFEAGEGKTRNFGPPPLGFGPPRILGLGLHPFGPPLYGPPLYGPPPSGPPTLQLPTFGARTLRQHEPWERSPAPEDSPWMLAYLGSTFRGGHSTKDVGIKTALEGSGVRTLAALTSGHLADVDQLPLSVQWSSISLLASCNQWTAVWVRNPALRSTSHPLPQPWDGSLRKGSCQHLRNMQRTGFPGSAGLRSEGEWRPDRSSPFTAKVCDARAWQVYIDNFELQAKPISCVGPFPRISRQSGWLTTTSDVQEPTKRIY